MSGNYPKSVVSALRERQFSDEQIATMEPEKAFVEYCEWHGLTGWGETLWELAHKMGCKARQKERRNDESEKL